MTGGRNSTGRTGARALALGFAVALALGLAGCGTRGSLEKPPEAKAEEAAAKKAREEAKAAGQPPPKAEHKPFILDPLIR